MIPDKMYITCRSFLKEILSLLTWSMLAACTVGPGTVVTCARAGSEQGLNLIWALIFATVLAYTLQEGSARLTISSGRSLGQCLRLKYENTYRIYNVALICWIVSIAVFIGNTMYECNNWAGGMSAIYALPSAENTDALRISCCIGYGLVVYALLYWDKTDWLSVGLGIILMAMVALFLIVVSKLGMDGERFAWGLIPNMPPGSANLILSLVGTTSIGFNLFLGSSIAEGKELAASQRGIAFSVFSAFIVSVLIMIVGDGVTSDEDGNFTIENLAGLIRETVGEVGLWIFSLGFIAAALSSMLTVPLGAALTADSMFTIKKSAEATAGVTNLGVKGDQLEMDTPKPLDQELNKGSTSQIVQQGLLTGIIKPSEANQALPRWIYQGIMIAIVVIAVIVISADFPTEDVIQIAQVFNGCLLPFFAICLLLCLNDQQFMDKSPQKWWSNIFLILAVTITLFLALNVFIQNIFGQFIPHESIKFGIAGGLAPVIMIILCLATSLGKDIVRSFKGRSLSYEINNA